MKKRITILMLIAILLSIGIGDVYAYPVSINEEESLQPLEYSVWDFLKIALEPVGSTLYIWGGGWNEEDTAAGVEAVSIGVSPLWQAYFDRQNQFYNYELTRYQIHNGLDCSGYVGWTVYNLLHRVDGGVGYVMNARKMAKNFSERGWGQYTPAHAVRDYLPGDIMSSKTHVYIVLGSCSDGSILVVHASPPGVQINGTVSRSGSSDSEAIRLANRYMKSYYPKWYQRYGTRVLDSSFLHNYSQMRWHVEGDSLLTDKEGLRKQSAENVMKLLLGEPDSRH